MRSVFVFALLLCIKALSLLFYRIERRWVGNVPEDPWAGLRIVALLNHTSLYELVFLGGAPLRLLWRLARHGVIPAAQKTIDRPLVRRFYGLVAHRVIAITRKRDHTWDALLGTVDRRACVLLATEGRMKRPTGLDKHGQRMKIRGGIADILEAVGEGRMLLAYSEGLHHVQVPGRLPNVWTTVRIRLENLDIASYVREQTERGGGKGFREAVVSDLERRRDLYCAPT